MFYCCSSLKYLDLSNFNTSNLNNINYMFEGCSSLMYLNLYSFKLNDSVKMFDIFDRISSSIKYGTKDIN